MVKYLVYHDGDNKWKVRRCLYLGQHKQTGLPLIFTPDWNVNGQAGPRVVWSEGLFESSAAAATKADQLGQSA